MIPCSAKRIFSLRIYYIKYIIILINYMFIGFCRIVFFKLESKCKIVKNYEKNKLTFKCLFITHYLFMNNRTSTDKNRQAIIETIDTCKTKEKIENLTSCERTFKTLAHKEPDRIPFDLGGTSVAGISLKAYKNSVKY